MDDKVRRNQPLFSMSIVGELTGLTARQIRYYEEHKLVQPKRSQGNRRLFSFNDVERLLEVKALLDKGVNLAGIKHVLGLQPTERHQDTQPQSPQLPDKEPSKPNLSDAELMKMLKKELFHAGNHGKTSLIQGELSRFFH